MSTLAWLRDRHTRDHLTTAAFVDGTWHLDRHGFTYDQTVSFEAIASFDPDDAELGMAGTILKMRRQGRRVGILDLTDGEPTPYGSIELRAKETAAATAIAPTTCGWWRKRRRWRSGSSAWA